MRVTRKKMGNNDSEDEWKTEEKKKKEVIFVESFKLGFKFRKLDVKEVLTFTIHKVKNLTFNAEVKEAFVLLWGMRNLILKAGS